MGNKLCSEADQDMIIGNRSVKPSELAENENGYLIEDFLDHQFDPENVVLNHLFAQLHKITMKDKVLKHKF